MSDENWVVLSQYDGEFEVTGPTTQYSAKRIAGEKLEEGYDIAEVIRLRYIDNTPY